MGEVISLELREIAPTPPRTPSLRELPSSETVPIVKEYGRLGLHKFIEDYAVKTRVDERGFVDYGWLLGYIHSLTKEDHVWTGRLDIHHLQWMGDLYSHSHFEDKEDPTVPERFREIPFHKLLIPRDMHDLIHIVTLPPDVPEYTQMKRRVEAYDTAMSLFQKAKQALDIETQEKRLVPAPHPGYRDKTFDPVKRKLIEREVLLDRYAEFTGLFHSQLSRTSQEDVDNLINMDILKNGNPVVSLVTSLDRAVRLNKQKQAIRPKVRWEPQRSRKAA